MKLSSVRALKEEFFTSPGRVFDELPLARAAAFRARTRPAKRQLGASAMHGIALGAVRAKKDYKLAVRQQESSPLVHFVTEEIVERAKGEVDVAFIGKLVPFAAQVKPAFYRTKRRPLRIGASISDVQLGFVSAGTLGCFVSGRRSPHYLAMLTNNHVIADENANANGDPVVQQGTLDGGSRSANLVGELWKFIRLRKVGNNIVDAAIGAIYDDIDYDESTIGTLGKLAGIGDVRTLPRRATVYKVGRTTGQTKGRITAFDVDNVLVDYGIGQLSFDGQMEIEGTENTRFSDSGDSGSIIVDSKRRAIGLLFAGGDVGGSNGKGLTYANPVAAVLDALDVDLLY